MGTISGHQLATFSSPVNGTTPIDANVVRSNDNTIKTSYNAHDADATIHLQSGAASARPSQGTAGQTWLATDTGAVYLSIDNGSAWVDINYIRTTVTSLPSNVVSSSLTTVGILASPHMTSPTVDSGGMTISSGTLAAQAVTATSVTASTSFQIGGATATDVRLQHSGGALQVRLGDNSDYGDLTARSIVAASGLTVSAGGITVSAGGASITGNVTVDAAHAFVGQTSSLTNLSTSFVNVNASTSATNGGTFVATITTVSGAVLSFLLTPSFDGSGINMTCVALGNCTASGATITPTTGDSGRTYTFQRNGGTGLLQIECNGTATGTTTLHLVPIGTF